MRKLDSLRRQCLQIIVPSFLHPLLQEHGLTEKGVKAKRQESVRPTDFLDGLRGVAAVAVTIRHYTARPFPKVALGYGFRDNYGFFQLPFIRIVYTGATMVSMFFIISGFVLSNKSIKLIRAQSHAKLLQTLSSTTFRRAVRLFLPTLAASFLCYLAQRGGFLGRPYKGYVSTFSNDTAAYFEFLRHLYDVWTWEPFYGFYSAQLWTIPVEFRCSMVVFLTLLGLSRCRMRVRLSIEICAALTCFWYNRWDMAPFFIGMTLAELQIHFIELKEQRESLDRRNLPVLTLECQEKSPNVRQYAAWTLLVAGMFVGSVPQKFPWNTPGYIWLTAWMTHDVDTYRYVSCVGATMIISAILLLPVVQKLFTSPVAKYSGKISYALYLTHGIINRAFGVRFQAKVWVIIGSESTFQYGLGYAIGLIAYLAFSVWIADIFWRLVDEPSVRLARWLEDGCIQKPVLGN